MNSGSSATQRETTTSNSLSSEGENKKNTLKRSDFHHDPHHFIYMIQYSLCQQFGKQVQRGLFAAFYTDDESQRDDARTWAADAGETSLLIVYLAHLSISTTLSHHRC